MHKTLSLIESQKSIINVIHSILGDKIDHITPSLNGPDMSVGRTRKCESTKPLGGYRHDVKAGP